MGNTNEEAGQQIIQSSERKTTNMSEKKGEEELEVISARSLLETMDSTQRTSAEIESIPEEVRNIYLFIQMINLDLCN